MTPERATRYALGDSSVDPCRLELLARIYDPLTQAYLQRLPVERGAHCLEVGAGSGSIAKWLAEKVGPSGHVVATDLAPDRARHLLDGTGVEVRKHDIVADSLERNAYDLVHARMVLEHVGSAGEVVLKLAASLRPGGWLVLEDVDKSSGAMVGAGDALLDVRRGIAKVMASAGFHPTLGRHLPRLMLDAELIDVNADARAFVTCGALDRHGQREMYRRLIGQTRDGLLQLGIDERRLGEALNDLQSPDLVIIGSLFVSASGQMPTAT